ncbi:MAG: hypothetical protein J5814_02060 [Bacteroidaceae bacterium]|nr:hypothetical protein [Bacteroidaceae bacterium]
MDCYDQFTVVILNAQFIADIEIIVKAIVILVNNPHASVYGWYSQHV